MLVSDETVLAQTIFASPNDIGGQAAAEAFLVAAWSSALRGKTPKRDQPYWELGINSNRALAILRYIWTEIGLDLPVNIFVEAPTIRAMAARLCNGTATHAQDIVQMGGAGGESALFLFAGGAGFLHELTDLVRALHVPGTIYGVASAGADGRDVEIETHQQEGARAAALIRGVRPYGPYHIAGYSLGGSTALETARILRNAGEDVHLIMLDSGLNEHCWPLPVWLKYIAGRAIGRLKRRPSTGEAARVRLPDLAPVKRGKMFQFRFLDPRHPDYPYHSPHWQSCHPPVYTRVRARAIVMRGLYRPLPYEGKVTFFSSAGGDTMACSPSQAWSKYLPNAEWMTTPGNHASMIMGRHAKQLAAGMVSHLTRGKMPIQRREAAQPAEAQGWGEMAGLPQPA